MEQKRFNADDIEFLKLLGHEMNTQENDSQADPRFWVVAENKREYGYDDGYCDGTVVINSDGEFYDSPEELIEHLVENECVEKSTFESGYDYVFSEILGMINQDDYSIVNYCDMRDQIAPNTMFLTKQECKRHIELNDYHYTQPHTYAMTAWRSPQIERLYDILKNTDWSELAALKSENELLKAERNALIESIKGNCTQCSAKDATEIFPCNYVCPHMNSRFITAFNRPFTREWICDKWQWRGLEVIP